MADKESGNMNYNLTPGISLDDRTIYLSIPANTTISTFKKIVETDNANNYIAEDLSSGVSRGYYHYVNEDNQEVFGIFYNSTDTNLQSIKLPEDFGTITKIDDTSVLYQYISRASHEKVYVTSEDFAKEESMRKSEILANVEETVRGYGVPVDSVLDFDGEVLDIPGGYEIIDDTNYYDEITYTKGREFNTDYYITTIPVNDNKNKQIDFYVGNDDELTPLEYAQKNYTTLTTNGYLYIGSSKPMAIIQNGVVIQQEFENYQTIPSGYCYIGFKSDRSVTSYQANETTAQDMIEDGVINAFLVYYKIIDNGNIVDMEDIELSESVANLPLEKHPRQCLGVKNDGTIIILTNDGRTDINEGLTSQETANILSDLGCINAWNLDGGGSTSTILKGSKINRNIDGNGTQDRKIIYTLNVKKQTFNKEITKAFSEIGKEKQNILQQIIPYINNIYSKITTSYYTNVDLNDLIGKMILGYCNGATNKPDSPYGGLDNGFYFINIPHAQSQFKDLYNLQFFIRRDYKEIWSRRQVNGVFTDWWCINQHNKGIFEAVIGVNSNNKILADNTYQDIVFKNNLSNNNFIKPDPTTIDTQTEEFTSILVDSIGYADVRVSGTIQCVTAGTKYFKITFGGSDTSAVYSFNADTPGRYNFSLETLQRITGNTGNTFKIKMYGSIGDFIQRCNCLIDFDR